VADDEPTRAVPSAAVIAKRYRLEELVARGGTAEVWRATDTSLDRVVALKLVTAAHDDSSARAADEAKTLAQLSHPSLVQVYDAGTDASGRPWVVMEFIDGRTLADGIRSGPQPTERIAQIGIAVADALAHVHARGMVHRDVKPANVLLGSDGAVKLTDFGIARLVDAARVTSTGLMVGTASYLSPEQVQGADVGPPTDVYSLGLVLLEALTGVREYDGPAVEAAMARLSRDPDVPATLGPSWVPLLQAMTSRQAEDRPTAAEVAEALRGMLDGRTTVLAPPVQQRTTALPRTAATPVPAAPASRRTAWVVAGVVAVLALGGAGYALAQGNAATPDTIHPVSNDLPSKLRTDLRDFVDQVQTP
jgi:serine/threonine protein kinase